VADNEQQMVLVAKLVDQVTDKLKTINTAMLATQAAAKKAHEVGGKAAAEHAEKMKGLREGFDRAKRVAEGFVPTLATLGITAFGVGAAMSKLGEQLKAAAERYDLFNQTIKRGKVGVQYVDQLRTMYQSLGIDADRANTSISEMGETFEKLKRGNSEERQRLQGTFGNMLPFIEKAIKGAKNYAEAEDQIVDAIKRRVPLIDQQRKAFEALHMPGELADKTPEQIEAARARGRRSALDHPTNLQALKELNEAYTELGVTQSEFWRDLTNDLAPGAAKAIRGVTELLKEMDETYRSIKKGPEKIDNPNAPFFGGGNWLDRLDMALGVTPHGRATPQDRINEAFGALGSKKAEEAIEHGTTKGVLDALREWFGSSAQGGYQPMAYHPGGGNPGGVPRFGSREYPNLGTTRGADVPPGGGPPSKGVTGNRKEVAKIVRDEWRRAGMSDEGIAGLMQNIMDESGFNPTLRHFDQPKFRGTEAGYAHGLYQEGGDEWNHYAAWLKKYHPGADWRDPRLQSRFAAENLKKNYPHTWRKMQSGNRYQAAAAYVAEYLNPADRYKYSRMRKYLRGGVGSVEHYAGPEEQHGDGVAHLRDHIRNKSLLKAGKQSGLFGGAGSSRPDLGNASVTVDFKNMPRGILTAGKGDGVFKEVRLNRGAQMAPASQDG
jgi:hypothetical protein